MGDFTWFWGVTARGGTAARPRGRKRPPLAPPRGFFPGKFGNLGGGGDGSPAAAGREPAQNGLFGEKKGGFGVLRRLRLAGEGKRTSYRSQPALPSRFLKKKKKKRDTKRNPNNLIYIFIYIYVYIKKKTPNIFAWEASSLIATQPRGGFAPLAAPEDQKSREFHEKFPWSSPALSVRGGDYKK